MEKKLLKKRMVMDFFENKMDYISKNDMMKDDNYMLWLDDFMVDKVYFTNQTEYYLHENVSIDDLNNMMNLKQFYNIIDSYAKDIGFSTYQYENINYYLFQHNGVGYKIMIVENDLLICSKIEIYDYEYFFDYEKIKNNIAFKRYN